MTIYPLISCDLPQNRKSRACSTSPHLRLHWIRWTPLLRVQISVNQMRTRYISLIKGTHGSVAESCPFQPTQSSTREFVMGIAEAPLSCVGRDLKLTR